MSGTFYRPNKFTSSDLTSSDGDQDFGKKPKSIYIKVAGDITLLDKDGNSETFTVENTGYMQMQAYGVTAATTDATYSVHE